VGAISETWRELRALLRLPGFRKLFAVRLVSQTGDGMFQVGLASMLFFSPERAGTAPEIAGAFAVMLAPFTVVGPFAGVFLDRWRRRQVLAVGNAVRVVLAAGMAAIMLAGSLPGGAEAWIVVLALAALSVNRFLLAGLSAGLPRVVAGPLLLTANSLTPTLGASPTVRCATPPRSSPRRSCSASPRPSRCGCGPTSSAPSTPPASASERSSPPWRAGWPTARATSSGAAPRVRACSSWRCTGSCTASSSSRRSSSRATCWPRPATPRPASRCSASSSR
jgi:hypothetical protein